VKTRWIEEETDSYTIPLKGVTAKRVTYRISDLGVDYFEGPSKFGKTRNHAGIDISNVSGIVVVGDRNIVQSQFEQLYHYLSLLEQSINISDSISNEKKIGFMADVETIKSQLAKPNPDEGIVTKAWNAISALSTVPALIELLSKIRKIVGPLVGLA
jgi:hypothetical protein